MVFCCCYSAFYLRPFDWVLASRVVLNGRRWTFILLCLDSKSQKTDENNMLVSVISLRLRILPYFLFLVDKKCWCYWRFPPLYKGRNGHCKCACARAQLFMWWWTDREVRVRTDTSSSDQLTCWWVPPCEADSSSPWGWNVQNQQKNCHPSTA